MSRTLLIGIPGAGKSTLAPDFGAPVIALDELRHALSDGTPAGDYLARSHFLRACQERLDATFEFNGAGSHRHPVRLSLAMVEAPLLVVYVRVPVEVALARVAARGTQVPVPDYGLDHGAAFRSMVETLEHDLATGFWARPGWTVQIRENG